MNYERKIYFITFLMFTITLGCSDNFEEQNHLTENQIEKSVESDGFSYVIEKIDWKKVLKSFKDNNCPVLVSGAKKMDLVDTHG